MPFLFGIPLLSNWLVISILYLNGAVIISSILQVFLTFYKSERKNEGTLSIAFTLLICLFHALITAVTSSIIIPVILRIIYGFSVLKYNKK